MRTPPRSADLLSAFPELAAHARTATRLHPRPAPVRALDSHVGGPLRWPSDEPWPMCAHQVMVYEEVPLPLDLVTRMRQAEARRVQHHILAEGEVELHEEIAAFVGPGFSGWGTTNNGPVVGRRTVDAPHPTPTPLIAVAQLRAADIPDLPRPDGADLLQILWCPFDHADTNWGPALALRWRREADVTEPFLAPPTGDVGEDEYVPEPCRLYPEQVVDYPFCQELPADLQDRLKADERYLYSAIAPGWKVGGYASWHVTDLQATPCPQCAAPTNLLFVIDSKEYDSATREYWQPLDDPDPDDAQEPTGVIVGRYSALRIFACLTCPGTPIVTDLQ
ncbi:hypothetical protein AB0K00_14135 [Dactylosporangium sp. NPDC049525]|uniref:hypothetical protein n=1 Tax=Dactylosporangium sp. NPDC049525 TaxID=3154730 RepID=UPI0034318FE7